MFTGGFMVKSTDLSVKLEKRSGVFVVVATDNSWVRPASDVEVELFQMLGRLKRQQVRDGKAAEDSLERLLSALEHSDALRSALEHRYQREIGDLQTQLRNSRETE